ncbi:MAG: ABC transporter permease, partial [Dehalococcoidia bacterium]
VSSDRVIVDSVAVYLTTMDGIIEWIGFVDVLDINSRNASDVESRVGGLRSGLLATIPRTSVSTILDETIDLYESKLFFTRLPLFALMLQIVGIVLYYLVMVATMLQERQTGEIALLRSRGASIYQIVGMTAIEGLFICGTAVILGPLLAVGGIAVLGLTPPFQDLSNGELLHVPLTRMAFLMAGIGAGLAFVALLWPAYQAARKTMVDYKSTLARPDQQPLFLRYYLDLVLIGAAAFAFYQLRQRGSLVTERLFGDLSADPLLLISPILFMLMVALVFIRLFPLGLRLVSLLTAGLRGPTVALGMWRMVRSPMHYSRLILLLLLATAVGMFAAGFRATLERSYDDRAAYEAVAGARLAEIRAPLGLPQDDFTEFVQTRTGASEITPVVRLDGGYNRTLFDRVDLDLVGLDPDGVPGLVFWRDDFAGRSPEALLDRVRLDEDYEPALGPPVPAGSRYIGMWVYTSTRQAEAQPWVRLRGEDGEFLEYRLFGPSVQPPEGAWQFFAADLSRPGRTRQRIAPRPTTLDAVFVRISGQPPPFPETVTVLFDELQATSDDVDLVELISAQEDPGWTVFEGFEEQDRYELITGSSRTADFGALSRAKLEDRDSTAVRISYVRQFGTPPIVGMRVSEEMKVLPVIADRAFLDEARLERDEEFLVYFNHQYVPVKVVDTFDLFPTYDPESRQHLLIGDIGSVSLLGSRVPFFAAEITPSEAWLDGVDLPFTRDTLAQVGINAGVVLERSQLRAEAASDPLVAASWQGILFLSFSAVLVLTALGFGVYAVLAARARTLEFAILRTMGYTSRQILVLVSFEQLFVIGAGVIVGTTLGFPLGRLMLSYLGTTESGTEPLPPLVSEVSWVTVVTVYSLIAVVFLFTVGALARTYSRLAIARALRIGEI